MHNATRTFAIAGLLTTLLAPGAIAEDAMAKDAMAMDAMAPMMSEEDMKLCLDQAMAITFPSVAMAAEAACKALKDGHGAMGGAMMGGDAMQGGVMAPAK